MVPAQQRVSIHALLAECDHIRCGLCPGHSSFNPRTPCGVRPSFRGRWWRHTRFQSTHSLRSATFDTLPVTYQDTVSIHALLAECDRIPIPLSPYGRSFNPRTPCGVRPLFVAFPPKKRGFQSTHSLRSATPLHHRKSHCSCRFNPRTPCGVRPSAIMGSGGSKPFQSTHSLRSATVCGYQRRYIREVSIHALLAECDGSPPKSTFKPSSFNPRTPCGVRPTWRTIDMSLSKFQSTHSLRSATRGNSVEQRSVPCFNPRTPCGVRRMPGMMWPTATTFQSTHSLRSATRSGWTR